MRQFGPKNYPAPFRREITRVMEANERVPPFILCFKPEDPHERTYWLEQARFIGAPGERKLWARWLTREGYEAK